jgi:uncharacterized membrane protein YhaH (DUF805 family)
MESIWFWILISVVIGAMAGLIAMSLSRNRKAGKSSTPANADSDAVDDLEGSSSSNIALIITVFSILAFLIIWLVMAVLHRGIFS